ncbi:hypothetical protein FB451DRAFT_370636 [Mycena latifolia]|nr:hypothetical protein FB451DRAFT_370636 [Mycena latifolia]
MRYALCAVCVPLSAPTVRGSHALSWSWCASLSQRTVRSSRAHSCAFVLSPPRRSVCPVGALHRRMPRCAVLRRRIFRCFASQNSYDHHSCGARTQTQVPVLWEEEEGAMRARFACLPPPTRRGDEAPAYGLWWAFVFVFVGHRYKMVAAGVFRHGESNPGVPRELHTNASNNETRWCCVHYIRTSSVI